MDIVANEIIEGFMVMLKQNEMLNYELAPPSVTPSHLAPGEKVFKSTKLVPKKSAWLSITPPNDGTVILMVDQYQSTFIFPIKWEYCVRKLLAEYASLKNIIMDIPDSTPTEIGSEFARRVKSILSLKKSESGFGTPYKDFIHGHMSELNELVTFAIAAPGGLKATMVSEGAWKKQQLWTNAHETRISVVQWPKLVTFMRMLDGDNRLWHFDLNTIRPEVSIDLLYDSIQTITTFSTSKVASLVAAQTNHGEIMDPQKMLEGHMEFIVASKNSLLKPLKYDRFMELCRLHKMRNESPKASYFMCMIQPWKGENYNSRQEHFGQGKGRLSRSLLVQGRKRGPSRRSSVSPVYNKRAMKYKDLDHSKNSNGKTLTV